MDYPKDSLAGAKATRANSNRQLLFYAKREQRSFSLA